MALWARFELSGRPTGTARVVRGEPRPIQAEFPDRRAWLALTRTPSEWQYAFGPARAPVVIAGTSLRVRSLVAAIRSIGQPGTQKCVIVEGAAGSGKSLAVAAFQAACQESQTTAALVNEGSDPDSVIPRVSAADVVIVDNLDQLSAGLRRKLFERRHAAPSGTLITASRLSPVERQLLNDNDDYHLVGTWEEQGSDVLLIATVMWRDLALAPDLPDLCAAGVPEAISQGSWTHGGHSVRRFIDYLSNALAVAGYFERPPRPIEVQDILPALLAVIRDERPCEDENVVRIVVEGRTDAMYLEAAARAARAEWGTDLLSGCRVAPPGEDRDGGAEKVVPELIVFGGHGVIAVGLFDLDGPGRAAFKDAGKYTKQKVHVLPAEFDPLKNGPGSEEVEIEDLVSPALIARLYDENPELHPEETTSRGKLVRTVVKGPDKERAAAWVCEQASFEDLVKIVYVLCMLRQSIGLPLPDACPPLRDWIRELSAR